MKRSEINHLLVSAEACFKKHGWTLPPAPRWDVTDFGLGEWRKHGLLLINLAEEPEYCEKLMYAQRGMTTPAHTHRVKKEDIICRWGVLDIQLWSSAELREDDSLTLKVNGQIQTVPCGRPFSLKAGERVTLVPGVYHAFYPSSEECIIGEVSTANDDTNDNIFINPDIGRYPKVEEDEPPRVRLLSDKT